MPKVLKPILPPRWEFLISGFISLKKFDLLMLAGNSMVEVPAADIARDGISVMKFKWLALWNSLVVSFIQFFRFSSYNNLFKQLLLNQRILCHSIAIQNGSLYECLRQRELTYFCGL